MEDDRTYYERRLREELAKASQEQEPGLKALHQRWAQLYCKRIDALGSEVTIAQRPLPNRSALAQMRTCEEQS